MVELVDTTDLKSVDPNGSCGFKSRSGYKAKERPIAASLFGWDHSLSLMHRTDAPKRFDCANILASSEALAKNRYLACSLD